MHADILTLNEAIKYYRLSRATMFKLIRANKVRALSIGKGYRFKRCELEEDLRGLVNNNK